MRKYYIDNMKSFVIILVLIFHVVSSFASNGSTLNFNSEGIEAFDSIGYLIYPWFMILMFILSGMTAYYSLKKRKAGKFLSERVKSILLPFIVYQLTIGILISSFSFKVNNSEEVFKKLPEGVIKVIKILSGMGPSWFLIHLFVTSIFFIIVYKMFDLEKLKEKTKNINLIGLILLLIPIYLSGQFGYLALTYRIPLYTLAFFLGYIVFSNEEVLEMLSRNGLVLWVITLVLGAIQMYIYWGKVYQHIVNEPLVIAFSWFAILSVLGTFYKRFNYTNDKLSDFSNISFGVYLLHYIFLTVGAYLLHYYNVNLFLRYVILFAFTYFMSLIFTKLMQKSKLLRILFGV